MKSVLRILAIAVGVLILAVVAVPFMVPVQQFKPKLEQKASEALGRKVELGNLNISVWKGEISADQVAIADDPNFSPSPFLTAKSLKVTVKVLPLVTARNLDITAITIDSPQITLIRGAQAQWNYSNLGQTTAASAQGQSGAANSAAATPGQVTVGKFVLTNGQVSIGSLDSNNVNTYDHVNVTASAVSLTAQFPVRVTANLPGGGSLIVDGNFGPVNPTDTVLTPLHANVTIKALDLAQTGILDPAMGLSGVLDFQAHIDSVNGQSQAKGSATLSNALLVEGGAAASSPVAIDFTTEYNLQQNSGTLDNSTMGLGNATGQVSGTFETPPGQPPTVNLTVTADNAPVTDLESFLPALGIFLPKGATLQSGTLSANLTVSGPTTQLVTSGNAGLYNAKMQGFDLGSKLNTVAKIAGLKTSKDLTIEKMTTDLQMAPDNIKADKFVAVLPGLGTLSGSGTIDAKNNMNFAMQAKLDISVPGLVGGGSCKNALTVDFVIHGTTSDPQFAPSMKGTAKSLAKGQANCAVGAAKTAAKNKANNMFGKMGNWFRKKTQ